MTIANQEGLVVFGSLYFPPQCGSGASFGPLWTGLDRRPACWVTLGFFSADVNATCVPYGTLDLRTRGVLRWLASFDLNVYNVGGT